MPHCIQCIHNVVKQTPSFRLVYGVFDVVDLVYAVLFVIRTAKPSSFQIVAVTHY